MLGEANKDRQVCIETCCWRAAHARRKEKRQVKEEKEGFLSILKFLTEYKRWKVRKDIATNKKSKQQINNKRVNPQEWYMWRSFREQRKSND